MAWRRASRLRRRRSRRADTKSGGSDQRPSITSFETRRLRIALHAKVPVARGGWNFREQWVGGPPAARRRPTQDEGCVCAAPVGGGLHAQRPAFGALVAPTVLAPQGAFCAARGLEGRLQCAPRDGKFVASHRMTGIDVEAVTHGSRPADVAVRETGAPLTTAHGEFVATSHVGISRSCFVGCWPPRISECSPD